MSSSMILILEQNRKCAELIPRKCSADKTYVAAFTCLEGLSLFFFFFEWLSPTLFDKYFFKYSFWSILADIFINSNRFYCKNSYK